MTRVQEAIEEIIEESYLLGLSEKEIREDFKQFIDTCYNVIHHHIKDRDVVPSLAESLAREKTVILIADRNAGLPLAGLKENSGNEETKSQTADDFGEKVARRKRQILRTLAKYDPDLVRIIDEHRFQGEIDEPVRPVFRRKAQRINWKISWSDLRVQMLKVGYAATVGLVILLIWYGLT